MRPGTALLLTPLVLLVALQPAENSRQYDKLTQVPEARFRRHDSEEQRPTSGRRWTTSRNSPYQKIVSYERAPVEGEGETGRSQRRPGAPARDQVAAETSTDDGVDEPGREADEGMRGQARRRSGEVQENSTPKNKKRRRTTTAKTTTPAPQTMSDTLYKHFRPLDQNVPEDDIIPFLDFGRKLSAVVPTPSSANSIDNRSSVTRHRVRPHQEDREGFRPSDEDLLQEDMDVTVVKKAIERNSVPRAKLRVKEQGISDYYRKRAPAQVRTTENLISTDSSTASSIPGSKTVLKKINRLHVHLQPAKNPELFALRSSDVEMTDVLPKNVELIHEKRRPPLRSNFRSAALRDDNHPLTAESSVVRTVIKDPSTVSNSETQSPDSDSPRTNTSDSTTQKPSNLNKTEESLPSPVNPSLDDQKYKVPIKNEDDDKISSTTVVTSVSVRAPTRELPQPSNETSVINISGNQSSDIVPEPIALAIPEAESVTQPRPLSESSISSNNTFNLISKNNITTNNNASIETLKQPITTTERLSTSLRARDFYKPKPIPPGANIPHLPRRISLLNTNGTTRTLTSSTTPSTISYERPVTENGTIITPESSTSTSPKLDFSYVTSSVESSTPSSTVVFSVEPPSTITQAVTRSPLTASTSAPVTISVIDAETSGKVVPVTSPPQPSTFTTASSAAAQENPAKDQISTVTINSRTRLSTTEAELSVEMESVPPPRHYPEGNSTSDDTLEAEDLGFPIYFTTLTPPSPMVPMVDTRPQVEQATVREQKNSSTLRPPGSARTGADWVRVGAVDKDVVEVYSEPLGVGAYLLAALGVVPIVIGALLGARFILAHNRKKVLDESEYSSEYNRSPLSSNAPPLPTKLPRIPTHMNWNEPEKSAAPPTSAVLGPTPGGAPTAAKWEFPREKLRLQTLLGQGNFGQVWKAEADDISGHEGLTRLVAVKTVKESANAREREDLLRELGIMQELGSHPNVVTLLGCCTEKEPIYLIMEYVMYGKLLSFLRDHRTRAHYYNFSDATDALTSRDLTVFGYCVARGLDYLANKSIIHRDLAARNVLVDHNKLCKIADFGMSRNVRDTGQIYEQRQSKGALPIRWMAPESLHFSLFTHKTDVWSFGILMWEIVTLGSTPYARWGAREVMRRVMDGYRLERPTHCRPELFRVIAQCWHSEPSKRPSFAELKAELGLLLSDSEHHGSYVDLDSYADEMRRDTLHRHH